MNTLTAIAPVISADRDALRRDFPLKPFAIRHKLAGHPLLTLPRIAQLAAELPRDLIEYNSGKVAISQDPDAIPSVDLDPVEVVKRIETAGAWMVLKRVENSPVYRRLLEDTLLSVARARGFNSLSDAGFEQVEGFLFVSSPNSTTPFHLDSEDNFFVHIHGEKFFTIFDNTDRTIVGDDEIERSMTKHRNLKFDERFAKFSPGVQLTLDLTQHLCADPDITLADSTAAADHPMINPIWRDRLAIGDILVPLRRSDPMVPLIHAAASLRRLIREPARRAVHLVRRRQEKSS